MYLCRVILRCNNPDEYGAERRDVVFRPFGRAAVALDTFRLGRANRVGGCLCVQAVYLRHSLRP